MQILRFHSSGNRSRSQQMSVWSLPGPARRQGRSVSRKARQRSIRKPWERMVRLPSRHRTWPWENSITAVYQRRPQLRDELLVHEPNTVKQARRRALIAQCKALLGGLWPVRHVHRHHRRRSRRRRHADGDRQRSWTARPRSAPATLAASGTVTFTTSALAVGSNSITAVYQRRLKLCGELMRRRVQW